MWCTEKHSINLLTVYIVLASFLHLISPARALLISQCWFYALVQLASVCWTIFLALRWFCVYAGEIQTSLWIKRGSTGEPFHLPFVQRLVHIRPLNIQLHSRKTCHKASKAGALCCWQHSLGTSWSYELQSGDQERLPNLLTNVGELQ